MFFFNMSSVVPTLQHSPTNRTPNTFHTGHTTLPNSTVTTNNASKRCWSSGFAISTSRFSSGTDVIPAGRRRHYLRAPTAHAHADRHNWFTYTFVGLCLLMGMLLRREEPPADQQHNRLPAQAIISDPFDGWVMRPTFYDVISDLWTDLCTFMQYPANKMSHVNAIVHFFS